MNEEKKIFTSGDSLTINVKAFEDIDDRVTVCLPTDNHILENDETWYNLNISFKYKNKQWIQDEDPKILTRIMESTDNIVLDFMNSCLKGSTEPALEIISNEGNVVFTNSEYDYSPYPECQLVLKTLLTNTYDCCDDCCDY